MALNIPKGSTRVPFIPGTKPSIKNAQLLISTGVPSLDHVIGGGLPIGSIFTIQEDTYGTYAKILLKYFMSEGVVTDQPLFVGAQDVKPSHFTAKMPAVVADPTPYAQPESTDEQMKIAWRYQNMKTINSSPNSGQTFGHFYDLTKFMDKDDVDKATIIHWHDTYWHNEGNIFENASYANLLKAIYETLKNGQYSIFESPAKRQILRIAIYSLGSRFWLSDSEDSRHADLIKFLYYLKTLLRNSYAVAMISIPVDNFDNSTGVIERVEHISDIAVKLESFADSGRETNVLFKDYHGQLHIKKLAALNALAPHIPESRDLVFKLRRKKFIIEVLHLPPELGDTTQREQDDTPGCIAQSRKNLCDF